MAMMVGGYNPWGSSGGSGMQANPMQMFAEILMMFMELEMSMMQQQGGGSGGGNPCGFGGPMNYNPCAPAGGVPNFGCWQPQQNCCSCQQPPQSCASPPAPPAPPPPPPSPSPVESPPPTDSGHGGGDGGAGGGGGDDPLILDLGGTGKLDVTGPNAIKFDWNGNGKPSNMQWLAAGNKDGVLVDKGPGPNGQMTSANLIGTTGDDGTLNKYKSGWDKLEALYDPNHSGKIGGDALQKLSVWTDTNGDGKVEPGEMHSLASLGISEIDAPTNGSPNGTFVMNGKRQLAQDYTFQTGGQA